MISIITNVIQTKYLTLSAIFYDGIFFSQSKKHKLPFLGYLRVSIADFCSIK